MRTDVRLGVFFSMVIVLTLGGYFVYPRGGTDAIPLTGEVAAAHPGTKPTKLASNRKQSNPGEKSPSAAKKTRTRRSNKAKPQVPTQKRALPKRSTRHAGGATKKRNLPASGASLSESARRKSLQSVAARKNAAAKTSKTRRSPVQGAGGRMASKLTEKPGTPTPPGLLASTRKKSLPKNEPAVDLHRVQPGDTFATLAQSYYGSARYIDFLMKANSGVDPAKMQIGMTIRVPALSTSNHAPNTASAKPTKKALRPSASARTYTVRAGDSFYKIAQEQLGDSSRWDELFQANKKTVGNDPARLKVGQVLTLPAK